MDQLPDKNHDPLHKLIGKQLLEQPSNEFTNSVMGKLGIAQAPAAIRYEPVISMKVWIGIGIAFLFICYLALSGSTPVQSNSNLLKVESILQQTTSLFDNLLPGSFIVMMTIALAAIFILFSVESWYRRTRLHTV